jgi:hypothetical protein
MEEEQQRNEEKKSKPEWTKDTERTGKKEPSQYHQNKTKIYESHSQLYHGEAR